MKTAFFVSSNWNPGLHLGAARVALMNSLLAKKHKGQFFLFCNDYENAGKMAIRPPEQSIMDLLHWLGVSNDQGVYYMRHFAGLFESITQKLLASRWAYWDYGTHEEMASDRIERAKANDPSRLYSRKYAAYTEAECEKFELQGRTATIRLRMPRSHGTRRIQEHVVCEDAVFAPKTYDLAQEHDYVIKRANGSFNSCLLLPVVYDYWGIDTVVADAWHWSLIPVQKFIASRAQLRLPKFAHVPYLLEPDTNRRFSAKRHQRHMADDHYADLYTRSLAVNEEVEHIGDFGPFHPSYLSFYKLVGFLPEAIRHYLIASASLPHSPLRNKAAVSSRGLVEYFDIDKIGQEPDHFNAARVLDIQRSYMQSCNINRKSWLVNNFLRRAGRSDAYAISHHHDAPADVKILAKCLGDKIVIGGDILSLINRSDDHLTNREPQQPILDFISEGCPNC